MLLAPVARALLSFAGLLAVAAALTGAAHAARSDSITDDAKLGHDVLIALNAVRVKHGLAPLEPSSELDAAAAVHSDEMLADGYFSHDSADGSSYWQRIQAFYPDHPGATWAAGENILWASGPLAARRAVKLWMASRGHRRNILSPLWSQIGIAARDDTGAAGIFGDGPVVVLTTDFGTRS